MTQAVADADRRLGLGCGEQQPDRRASALDGEGVLPEQLPRALPGGGRQERAAAAGGVENAGRVGGQEPCHEQRQALRGLVDAAGGAFIQFAFGQDVGGGLWPRLADATQQRADRARVVRTVADRFCLGQGGRKLARGLLRSGDQLVVG